MVGRRRIEIAASGRRTLSVFAAGEATFLPARGAARRRYGPESGELASYVVAGPRTVGRIATAGADSSSTTNSRE